MGCNPDNDDYLGYGPQAKVPDTTIDARYLIPTTGALRFVKKVEGGQIVKHLQRFEWSSKLCDHCWFDVALVEEDNDGNENDT